MNTKYCLPIIKSTRKEVLTALNTKGYDYFEIWLDYIKDLDEKFIISVIKKFKGRLIFLFRRQDLENIKLTLQERQRIISLLANYNVFLDIDFLTQHEELEFLKKDKTKIKLILSFHDYRETPKLDYLLNLVAKMKRYSPDIYKFATFCQTEQDSLNLLNLLLKLKEQELKYIVLGMGEKGLITRIVGPMWGNEMIFAPKNLKEKSAKGQLTKKSLELILREVS